MADFPPLIFKTGRINERASGDSVLLTSAEITTALGYTPLQSPLTTRGDLLTQNPSGTHVRLAIGAAARYLRSDATDPVWAVLNASDIAAGTVPTARLGSGTADSTTFLRGDSTWAVPAGGGTITGSGTTGRVAQFTGASAIGDSNLIGPASNLLTFAASSNGITLTVPATGTAALLATANTFTAINSFLTSGSNTSNQIIFGSNSNPRSRFGTQGANSHQWAVNIDSDNSTRDDSAKPAFAFVIDVSTAINEFAVYNFAVGENYRELMSVRPAGAIIGYTATSGFFGSGDFVARLHVLETLPTSTTTATPVLAMTRNLNSGTPGVGFGGQELLRLHSSTTKDQSAAQWDWSWVVATHASRTARIVGTIYDTAAREWIRGEASGTAAMIGFLGAAASARQTGGENVTNNVTSGGTNGTITNWTNLSTYSTDAAAIRNAVYQLARLVKQDHDALRLYGLLT